MYENDGQWEVHDSSGAANGSTTAFAIDNNVTDLAYLTTILEAGPDVWIEIDLGHRTVKVLAVIVHLLRDVCN